MYEIFINDPASFSASTSNGGTNLSIDNDTMLYLFDTDGVASGLSAGKTVVDMSSISPIDTKAFAKRIMDRYVDEVAAIGAAARKVRPVG